MISISICDKRNKSIIYTTNIVITSSGREQTSAETSATFHVISNPRDPCLQLLQLKFNPQTSLVMWTMGITVHLHSSPQLAAGDAPTPDMHAICWQLT